MVLPQPGYTTFAEIDTQRLKRNITRLRKQAGEIALMAVIKADAYGHGMTAMAPHMLSAGIKHFMVATLDEAIKLRTVAPNATILVASPPHPENLPIYAALKLDASVTSAAIAEQLLAAPQNHEPVSVHIKINTGMNRLGLAQAVAPETIARLLASPAVRVAGLWSHLATAGDPDKQFARQQIEAAYAILDNFPDFDGYFHVGNSGTLLNLRDEIGRHHKELVRLGGAFLGIPASRKLAKAFNLEPVMALKSRVIHVNNLVAGDAVSYGRTWTAPATTRIAVIGAGYADGYPSALSDKGTVKIGNAIYPIVGRVCMDMFMVELGKDNTAVQPGDEVLLFGEDHATMYELAKVAGLVHYEICCRIPLRVPRTYL